VSADEIDEAVVEDSPSVGADIIGVMATAEIDPAGTAGPGCNEQLRSDSRNGSVGKANEGA
jgi:hypothetical protein